MAIWINTYLKETAERLQEEIKGIEITPRDAFNVIRFLRVLRLASTDSHSFADATNLRLRVSRAWRIRVLRVVHRRRIQGLRIRSRSPILRGLLYVLYRSPIHSCSSLTSRLRCAAFGQPAQVALGKGWVQEWLARTLQQPMSEFNSTTNSTLHNSKYFPLDQKLYVDASHDTGSFETALSQRFLLSV